MNVLTIGVFFCLTCLSSAEKLELVAVFGQSNAGGRADGKKLNAVGLEGEVLFKSGRQGRVTGRTLAPQLFRKDSLQFGPEMSFGLSFAQRFPQRKLAIYKWAHGGTGLAKHWHHQDSSPEFRYIETAIRGLLAYKQELAGEGYQVSITAILWDQGESDSGNEILAQGYQKRLREIVSYSRSELKEANLFWIIRRLGDWQIKKFAHAAIVQQAQEAVAASDSRVFIYNSNSYGQFDGVHLDYKGQVKSGIDGFKLYEQAFLKGE